MPQMSPFATLAMAACKREMAVAKGGGDCSLMCEPCRKVLQASLRLDANPLPSARPVYPHQQTPSGGHAVTVKVCQEQTDAPQQGAYIIRLPGLRVKSAPAEWSRRSLSPSSG